MGGKTKTENPARRKDEALPKMTKQSTRPVGSLYPDSGLHPVGAADPFYALVFRPPSLTQNPQAGYLASTLDEK